MILATPLPTENGLKAARSEALKTLSPCVLESRQLLVRRFFMVPWLRLLGCTASKGTSSRMPEERCSRPLRRGCSAAQPR